MPSAVDLLVAGARIWVATKATARPANTVAYGAAWASWTDLGWTKETTKISYKADVVDLEVQQILSAVRSFKTKEEAMLETVLAEFNASNLRYAMDTANPTVVVAASGVPGSETITQGGNTALTELQWGFEGLHVDANGVKLPIRVFLYRGVVMPDVSLEFAKADYTGTPLKVKVLPDTSRSVGDQLFAITKITAPAL